MGQAGQVRKLEDARELRAQRLRGERGPRSVAQQERSLSKRQIAEHYGVSTATIDRWSREGLPWRRVGSRRKFRLSETEPWMRQSGKMD